MGHQDDVNRIRYNEVDVLRISLIHVYNSMSFYDLIFFVIRLLLLYKLGDLFPYISLSMIYCISGEPLYVCQTIVM